MIDSISRRAAALSLRRLASGRITNDEFEDAYPRASRDPVVQEVFWCGWALYSDNEEYRLIGADALPPATRRFIARAVLFLHVGLKYEWAPQPEIPVWAILLRVASFGRWNGRPYREQAAWEEGIDWQIWPFRRAEDLKRAASGQEFWTAA